MLYSIQFALQTNCSSTIDPEHPPVDYAPLHCLSLDEALTTNVTTLTVSSAGLRALILLKGINLETPFDLGQLLAQYLKNFKVLKELDRNRFKISQPVQRLNWVEANT